MARATLLILATFDYTNEVDYAESTVEVMTRVQEYCKADVLNTARDGEHAHVGHINAVLDTCAICGAWMSPEHRNMRPDQHAAETAAARAGG